MFRDLLPAVDGEREGAWFGRGQRVQATFFRATDMSAAIFFPWRAALARSRGKARRIKCFAKGRARKAHP